MRNTRPADASRTESGERERNRLFSPLFFVSGRRLLGYFYKENNNIFAWYALFQSPELSII
jgi:hypothetical protein